MQHRAGAADAASGSGSSGRRTPSVSWEAYRSWNLKDNDLYIGRKPSIKLQSNDIKLSVAMFTKLDEKILSSLPSGFPVRVDVPVAPGITGRVTFKNIETCEANKTTSLGLVLQDELFKIPVGYISSEVL
uniref:Vesicle-fusing ATPase n=1 Tax=Mesocestoides corti TaxID=53468 RepID=A0A5K3F3L3_MESCO